MLVFIRPWLARTWLAIIDRRKHDLQRMAAFQDGARRKLQMCLQQFNRTIRIAADGGVRDRAVCVRVIAQRKCFFERDLPLTVGLIGQLQAK